MSYIIKSGDGYYIRLHGEIPELTTDPVEATRMEQPKAQEIADLVRRVGFEAELIEVEIGKIPGEREFI